MVERGDKPKQIDVIFESGRVPHNSEVVAAREQGTRNSVINTLSGKKHVLELMGFSEPAEIRELPGDSRMLRIVYPLFEHRKLINTLEQSDLARPLSITPVIRSPQDKIVAVQTLISSPSSLEHLRKRSRADGLHLSLSLADRQTSVLQLQGAATALCPELFDSVIQPGKTVLTTPGEVAPLAPWEETSPSQPKPSAMQLPRLGPCSYAIFDLNIKQRELNWPVLLKHLAVLAQSADFCHTFDHAGNLVVIALNERAIGRLSLWADSIKSITNSQAHLFLGKGEVILSDKNNLVVDGYLSRQELQRFHKLGEMTPDIYSTAKVLSSVKGSRDETIVSLNSGAVTEGLVAIGIEKRINFHVGGGPDRLIGYQEEFKKIVESLDGNDPTRLIFLEGAAGTGKSRLINEVATVTPNVLKISIDPAGRNIAGFSIVDFADQIAVYLHEHLPGTSADLPPSVIGLLEFAQKSENEKLMDANKFTETICFYCLRTLEYLEEHAGPCTIMLDDAHHIDRFSDGYLMNLIAEILEVEMGKSKVILMRRPEQRYASIHQDNLQQRIQKRRTVSLHKGDGRPKLDFAEKDLAEEYILYSLPEKIRTNPKDGLNRMLGDWAGDLGAIANTPFELTSFLQEILSDIPAYLLIQKDYLELTREGLEKISKIQGKDMVVYHLERIREQLAPDTLKLLQVFALIGQKFASEGSLTEFMEAAFAFDPESTEWHLEDLKKKGYLVARDYILPIDNFSGDTYETRYSIWHENIRDILLNFTLDQAAKVELATSVYQASLYTDIISDNQKFSILHYAANAKRRDDSDFWNDYSTWGAKATADADKYQLYGQGYSVASLILHDLELEKNDENAVVATLLDMMDGREVDVQMAQLIIQSLFALVKNGYYLGQFSRVYQGIEIAGKIAAGLSQVDIDLPVFFQLGFDTAYAQINKEKLNYFHNKLLVLNSDVGAQKLNELKFTYRQGKYDQCRELFNGFPEDQVVPPEVNRLRIRIELETIINDVGLSGIDGDAVLSGLDLSAEQLESVQELQQKLKAFIGQLSSIEGGEGAQKRLNPVDELHVLDIEAQLCALNGQYLQSIRRFGESWRVAMQMDIPQEAVRAAKQKGDVEVFKAITGKPNAKSRLFYRHALKEAVHTYSEDGLNIAERLDDKTWKFYLSIQRLRAVCLLILTYDFQESCNFSAEVHGLMDMATEDVAFINQAPWTGYIPDNTDGKLNKNEYEVCYYITPLIVLYRRLCEDHDYQKSHDKISPFEAEEVIRGCSLFALGLENDRLRERFRKFEALCLKMGLPE